MQTCILITFKNLRLSQVKQPNKSFSSAASAASPASLSFFSLHPLWQRNKCVPATADYQHKAPAACSVAEEERVGGVGGAAAGAAPSSCGLASNDSHHGMKDELEYTAFPTPAAPYTAIHCYPLVLPLPCPYPLPACCYNIFLQPL